MLGGVVCESFIIRGIIRDRGPSTTRFPRQVFRALGIVLVLLVMLAFMADSE
jgi:hypothetical protein